MLGANGVNAAIKNSATRVQGVNGPDLNWDDLLHFLEVAEAGSLREAARRQQLTVNTVRNHLARLERRQGTPLIVRNNTGAQLTPAGRELLEVAMDMRRARLNSTQKGRGDALLTPGRITIAATEGLGTGWLTPKVSELRARLPDLTIDLQFDYDLQRDRSVGADLGIAFLPPGNQDLIVAKLATVHFMLFASPGYINQHGIPDCMDDLRDHLFVEQVAPGYNTTVLDLLLGSDRPREMVALQTNSSLTQLWAVVNGTGIALLPSYVRALTTAIVPLPVLPQIRFPVSYFFHSHARSSPAIRSAIDWLHAGFDKTKYPWFSDRFVHPDDFPRDTNSDQVAQLYQHMADRIASPRGR